MFYEDEDRLTKGVGGEKRRLLGPNDVWIRVLVPYVELLTLLCEAEEKLENQGASLAQAPPAPMWGALASSGKLS